MEGMSSTPISRRRALGALLAPAIVPARPKVAFTFDDVNWMLIPPDCQRSADERLLGALGRHRAALFVVGKNVDNKEGRVILRRWDAAGHMLGNHTYSHTPIYRTTPESFEADILRNEPILRPHAGFVRRFRFPQLKEGATRPARDHVRAFLDQHRYASGAVTIDASDWYYDQRLRNRPGIDVTRYRDVYLAHLWSRAEYYDGLAREVLPRPIPHTLLLHYNLINTLFLRDAIHMFESRGWAIVDATEAFADPVFARRPDTAPAGESLIWALAKETGRFESRLRYPGEDDVYEKAVLDRIENPAGASHP